MHVEKISGKLITICRSKITFIIIILFKKIILWGDGVMVKDLTPQFGSEEFKSPHLQPRLL